MQKMIYIRPHRVVTWATAEEEAIRLNVSLSEYLAEALREKLLRDTGEDTSTPAHLFPRKRHRV